VAQQASSANTRSQRTRDRNRKLTDASQSVRNACRGTFKFPLQRMTLCCLLECAHGNRDSTPRTPRSPLSIDALVTGTTSLFQNELRAAMDSAEGSSSIREGNIVSFVNVILCAEEAPSFAVLRTLNQTTQCTASIHFSYRGGQDTTSFSDVT